MLIENGDLDDHVPAESVQDAFQSRQHMPMPSNSNPRLSVNLKEFRDEMDAVGIDWRIHHHAQTPHGFALAPGWADHSFT